MTVYAFDLERRTNAQLIQDCAELGYLQKDWLTLDPTYGKGRFWTLWQPDRLFMSDINMKIPYTYEEISSLDKAREWRQADFTDLPWDDNHFDAVVVDPPYKLNGTGGSHPSDEGYGVADKLTLDDRHVLIIKGISECARVLKPGGYFLMKCQDQVSSGKVRWQVGLCTHWGRERHLKLVDMLFVLGGIEQPKGRRQVHARRNYSTCLVFKKAK